VEGGEGEDTIERSALRLPCLEVGVDDLDLWEARELAARDRGQLLAQFDAGDLEAELRQR
jgi:hypothetical protein